MDIIWWLVIGGLAGFLAGKFMQGRGFGVVGDIVIGIVGGALGGFLFGLLGLSSDGSKMGTLITAFVGAVVLLFLIRLTKKGN